jgi:hypothetical protein
MHIENTEGYEYISIYNVQVGDVGLFYRCSREFTAIITKINFIVGEGYDLFIIDSNTNREIILYNIKIPFLFIQREVVDSSEGPLKE